MNADTPIRLESGEIRNGVDRLLADCVEAWNAGDLERFLACYQDSPDTLIVAGSKAFRGHAAVRAMHAQYAGANPEPMGTFHVHVLESRALGADYAFVTARCDRTRASGASSSSLATLVLERAAGGWRIVVVTASS